VTQVTNLRARGVQFLDVPDKYYIILRERLKTSPVIIKEDINTVRTSRPCTCMDVKIVLHRNGFLILAFHFLKPKIPQKFEF